MFYQNKAGDGLTLKRAINAVEKHGLVKTSRLAVDMIARKAELLMASIVYPFLKPHEKDLPPRNFDRICSDMERLGYEVKNYNIDIGAFEEYLARAEYPEVYIEGIERARKGRFRAKALEHYVSETLFDFSPGDIYLDVAGASSPYPDIAASAFPGINIYRLDFSYEKGIHGERIGADATNTGLPEAFCSRISLHCSMEMFLKEDDIRLVPELYRLLKPGGMAVILPVYMYHFGYIRRVPYGRTKESPVPAAGESIVWHNSSVSMRRYGPETLKDRILDNAKRQGFEVELYRMANLGEVTDKLDSPIVLVLEKPLARTRSSLDAKKG